jgi:hypothetical protein
MIPIIGLGAFFGIHAMIGLTFGLGLIAYFINSAWSGRLISYPAREQLLDLVPSLGVAAAAGGAAYLAGLVVWPSATVELCAQLTCAVAAALALCEGLNLASYRYLRSLAAELILERTTRMRSDHA